jgi:hypothetical protein
LEQFRTALDISRSIFTGISFGIFGISKNLIFLCLPIFFPSEKKNPCFEVHPGDNLYCTHFPKKTLGYGPPAQREHIR